MRCEAAKANGRKRAKEPRIRPLGAETRLKAIGRQRGRPTAQLSLNAVIWGVNQGECHYL